jgi:hypothetical protein
MNYFTPEDSEPSDQTLNIIRQIAYRYRVVKGEDCAQPLCMN